MSSAVIFKSDFCDLLEISQSVQLCVVKLKVFIVILCLLNAAEEIVIIDTYGYLRMYNVEGYVMFMPFHLVQFVYELIAYA